MHGGLEWTDYPMNVSVSAVPGTPLDELISWQIFSETWQPIAVESLPAIAFGQVEPPVGDHHIVLHERPQGTLIWEPQRSELAYESSIGQLAKDQKRLMGSVVGNEGIGASFAVADAQGLAVAASNITQDEVRGHAANAYRAQFHEFDVHPGDLNFMRCVNFVSSVVGLEILAPQLCPPGERLLFGSLATHRQ
ncbi:hypothetical protein [Kineosporia babensis]|uniref:Uncharacterized protein n=1 Tax=Kineosporia babensis TaxID=499548 RepID=A0A9X1NPU2_9ACTN|nr:hypothetical protein [Kineosporia babensis]MCD5316968.1 hypothetical protein [Kineosporia babensis]